MFCCCCSYVFVFSVVTWLYRKTVSCHSKRTSCITCVSKYWSFGWVIKALLLCVNNFQRVDNWSGTHHESLWSKTSSLHNYAWRWCHILRQGLTTDLSCSYKLHITATLLSTRYWAKLHLRNKLFVHAKVIHPDVAEYNKYNCLYTLSSLLAHNLGCLHQNQMSQKLSTLDTLSCNLLVLKSHVSMML